MLQLVLAHGHPAGLLGQDVDGHQRGIGEQAGVDTLVGGGPDNLLLEGLLRVVLRCLDTQGFAGLVLERGRAHELADADVHVHQQVQLAQLGDIALHKDGGLFGVDAGGEVLRQDAADALVQGVRVGAGGQRVQVGDEETAVIVVLKLDKLAQGAVIVAQVQVAGGAYARQYYLF